jgi:hypothetical protein
MPDLPGRPPGWRQRGCRRRPRTGRTARSRRSATRRPHPGLVRSRHGGLLRPALRTGASCFPGRGPRTRAGTARIVLQGQRAGPAGPAPVQRVGGEVEEHLAGVGVISRVQGASSLTSSKCQRRGRARRAGHGGRSRCPRESAASWQAYPDGTAEPPIAGRPSIGRWLPRGATSGLAGTQRPRWTSRTGRQIS